MSVLKFNNDLFLGKEELNKFQSFLSEKGPNLLFKLVTKNYGVTGDEATSFLVTNGSSINTIHINNPSYCFDSNGRLITWDRSEDLIPESLTVGQWYWVKISYQISSLEKGSVSLSSTGQLSGSSTLFSEVLRGQPDWPVKIRVYSISESGLVTPSGDYSVLDVLSDTSALLTNPEGIQAISNGLYSIIGTFTEDVEPEESEKNIYKYDSCKYEYILSVDESIPDEVAMTADNTAFYIARIKKLSDSTFTIEDKRSAIANKFWRLRS